MQLFRSFLPWWHCSPAGSLPGGPPELIRKSFFARSELHAPRSLLTGNFQGQGRVLTLYQGTTLIVPQTEKEWAFSRGVRNLAKQQWALESA
jgi:hypothetical protein